MSTLALEGNILGMLIIDPDVIPYAEAHVSAEDFDRHLHQRTFEALVYLHKADQQIDLYSICRQMDVSYRFIATLASMVQRAPSPLNGCQIIDRWLNSIRGTS